MSVHLRRLRLTVHTKKQFLAGTNSTVKLWFRVDQKGQSPQFEPGMHAMVLDQPWHDDFQSGATDSYELDLDPDRKHWKGSGTPMPGGLAFTDFDHARTLHLHLEICGGDQWIFDRCAIGGDFTEVRPRPGGRSGFDVIELGWVEMARHSGEVRMSSDPREGDAEHTIVLNGSFA